MTIQKLKLILPLLIFLTSLQTDAQGQPDPKMEQTVTSLRGIVWQSWTDQQKESKAKEIDEAWKYLIAAGPKASARLKQEIEKIDAEKTKDDFFKLNATVVLWQIGKYDEAEYIAKVWQSTPIHSQYTYVFLTAFEAAQSQNPKVLPMIKAILKDDKGSMYVGLHAMNVGWPLSHEFIWGAYGPKGLSVLAEILDESKDEVELRSAMDRLAKAQYLPALARIRQLAASENDEVRRKAIQSLGIFGHPDDFDRLIGGLNSKDPQELFSYAFALYEFDDERAVKHLIPLLKISDEALRVEASLALLHLLTPEALAAVKSRMPQLTNPEVRKFLERSITLREEKLPKDYAQRPRDEQAAMLAKVKNTKVEPRPLDKPFNNQRLLEALRIWKDKGRIYNSGFDWVGEGNLIAAARPEDIDLMLEAKAAFYRRLSDECLYEVRDLDSAIKHVGRSRYRRGVGVTAAAELK